MGKLLSIIIPMYNCEKYIANCLDSIIESNLPSELYEIVVINDGSQDKGSEIAQDYASRYDNIVYLSQENQGQSVARNYGLQECTGEYVWFIDGDDKVEHDLLPIVDKLNENPTLDILGVHLRQVTEQDVLVEIRNTQPSVPHNKLMKGRDTVISGYNPSSVCALITRKELFDKYNLRFYPGITHQDVELSYQMMSHAGDVMFSELVPYVYIIHMGSTSKAIIPEKKIKYISDDVTINKSFRILADSFADSDPELSKVIRNRAQNVLFGLVYSLYTNKKEWKSMGVNSAVIAKMKEEGLYPLKGPFDSWKKTLMSKLLNMEWLIK